MKRYGVTFIVVVLISIAAPFVRQVERRVFGVKPQVYLENRCLEYYFEKEVRLIVRELAREINQDVINANIDKETGGIIPETNGVVVDIEATVEQIMSASSNSKLVPVLIEIAPLIRTEHLEPLQQILGDFSTGVMGSPGRVNNMRLSLTAINNTLVLPGAVFSFNQTVGERTREKGYQPAPIFLGETVAPGVGGGICQVSTTLYNAVQRANLEIVERVIHSRPPTYIQHGKDATVAWPYTDFKFRNNSDYPIIVKGAIQSWRVRVWIVGRQ